MKKCTPSSNTECRKRNLPPTEPSLASPTPNPSSSSNISMLPMRSLPATRPVGVGWVGLV